MTEQPMITNHYVDLCQISVWSLVKPISNMVNSRALPDYETRLFPGRDYFSPKHAWNHGMANYHGEIVFFPINLIEITKNDRNDSITDEYNDAEELNTSSKKIEFNSTSS